MQKIFRVMIIIAMLITAYLLVLAWRDDYADAPAVDAVPETTTSVGADIPSSTGAVGDIPAQTASNDTAVTAAQTTDGGLITVVTDRYDIKINPNGGDIVYAALKQYDATLDSDKPFVLLESDSNRVYVAQSGLMGTDGIDTAAGRAKYSHDAERYVMKDGQQTLSVPLTYEKDGVTVTKTFIFTHDKYPIDVRYQIQNRSDKPWQGQLFAQLKRDDSADPGMSNKGALSMATYLGGAWGTPDDPYNKLKFKDFNDGELTVSSKDGWVRRGVPASRSVRRGRLRQAARHRGHADRQRLARHPDAGVPPARPAAAREVAGAPQPSTVSGPSARSMRRSSQARNATVRAPAAAATITRKRSSPMPVLVIGPALGS